MPGRTRVVLPLLLLLAAILLPLAPARAQAPAPALRSALDSVLEATRASVRSPGAALYVAGPGVGAYSTAAGLADPAAGTPMDPARPVRIASLTKPFVAVVALQLVEGGWLGLDHSVERWLPGLVPGGDQITVRQLLQHTSGLPDYLSNGIVGRARRAPERVWTPRELVAEGLKRPRLFAPGTPGRWAYSNTNYILLGLIVEAVTAKPLDVELRERIIGPLGLKHTALAPASADPGALAHGFVRGRDYTALNMSVAWAAGGIYATVEDVGVFLRALVRGKLLRPETLAAMQQWVPAGNPGAPDLAYGLGLMRRTLPEAAGLSSEARLAIGHSGALGGYRIVAWYLPARDITVAAAFTSFEAEPNIAVVRTLETLVTQAVLQAP